MSDVISKSLIATIISDPKQFVSEVSKLDPVELKKIIVPLENLIATSMARENYLNDTLERIKGESRDTTEHVANANTTLIDADFAVTEAEHVLAHAAEDLDFKRSELIAAQATYKAKIEDLNFFKVDYNEEMFFLNADIKIITESIIKLEELFDPDKDILLPILKKMLSEKYERIKVLNNTIETMELRTFECGIAVINATTAVTDAEAVVTEAQRVLTFAEERRLEKQSVLHAAKIAHSAKIEERNIAQKEYHDELPILTEEQLVLSDVVTVLEQLHRKHTKTPTLSPTLTPTTLSPTPSPTPSPTRSPTFGPLRVSGIPTQIAIAKIGSHMWTDRSYKITEMPPDLVDSVLFQPAHYVDKSTIQIFSPYKAVVYVAVYESRDGGLTDLLPKQGWTLKDGWFVQWDKQWEKDYWERLSKIWFRQIDAGETISFKTTKDLMTFAIFIYEEKFIDPKNCPNIEGCNKCATVAYDEGKANIKGACYNCACGTKWGRQCGCVHCNIAPSNLCTGKQ